MLNSLISAVGLEKSFGNKKVVSGLSLTINEGEVLVIIGPNGAGKSTTLDMILGLKKQEAGQVEYWSSEYKKLVGVQLQTTPFFPGLSAKENLQLFASFYKKKLTNERALQLLSLCNLQDVSHIEASKLSGGQQKRLAIAISIAHDPKLVFLDEPTAALDPRSRKEVHELIKRLNSQGTTIVLTSHDMDEVEKLAHRVIMISSGQIVAQGSPLSLQQQFNVNNLEELYLEVTKEEN